MAKMIFKTEKASDDYIYNDGSYEVEIMKVEYGTSKNSGLAHYAFHLRGDFGKGAPSHTLCVITNGDTVTCIALL